MPFPRHRVTIFILIDNFYPFSLLIWCEFYLPYNLFISQTNPYVMLGLPVVQRALKESRGLAGRSLFYFLKSQAGVAQICGCLRDFTTLRVARFVFKIAHLTISMEPRGFRACGLLSRLWPRKSTDDNLYLKNICDHRRPRLCGSSLDFEFIRKCMKIYKKSPKFHFLTTLHDFLSVILVPFLQWKWKFYIQANRTL